ncbi:MAG: ATP-dependent helicase, partial [Deltaproteobacteria bacterium CG_4_9_14_3_um_filter_63_12]
SRGRIYPLREHGFVDAAVMARLITEKACEETRPVRAPLDVLAQVIVAMCVVEDWEIDALFAFVCSCWSYQTLARRDFDLVLEMLAGRYADSQIRELVPRLRIDRVTNKVTAKDGARLLLYRAGGVIPDRGYFNIRLQESGALIGQLDEEFVWERRIGDEFTIGTQPWKIARITHQDVLVIGAAKLGMAPFWRGESIDRDWALCEQIGLFLEEATARFQDPAWPAEVARRRHLDESALDELMLHLGKQFDATGPILPHRHHVLVEHYDDPSNSLDSKRVILHAQWGGRILRPLAICISAAWEERHGTRLEVMADDECLGLTLPVSFSVDDLLNLIPVEKIEPLLRSKLEATGFFGARFRENAARALLLPRKSLKRRMPLWLNRLRSKKLIEAVSRYEDFPILVETWRSCLHDHFDLDGLRDRLTELREGVIQVSEAVTKMPSPFADNVVWRSTDSTMYLDDTPQGTAGSKLSGTLIRELMNSSALRPRIPRALSEALQQKLHRTHVDYAPSDAAELVDLVEERLLIPWDEWLTLLAAIQRDHDVDLDGLLEAASERLVRVELPGARTDAVVLFDRLPRLLRGLGLELESVALLGLVRPGIPDAIAANLARLSLDVGALSLDVGALSLDVGALSLDVGALSLDVGALSLDVGALSLDEQGEDSLLERLAELLSELLRHYAVVERTRLAELVGLAEDALDAALELLLEQCEIVVDTLLEGSSELEVCDAENLERLLRLHRTAQRPQLEPLPLDALPLFLAALHNLTARGESLEDLQVGLERLFGYGAPAAAWEREFLPARMDPYHLAWLDSSLQNSDLIWFGCGHEQVAFCFSDWLDLYHSAAKALEEAADEADSNTSPFPTSGRFEFEALRQQAGLDSDALHEALWSQVWAGELSSESLASLRSGLLNKFKPEPMSAAPQRRRTGGWRSLKASTGAWFALHDLEDSGNARTWDELDEEEARRDRVRQLFSRYGVLFKERLSAEQPALQWRSVQRTLRLMEFSGEAISGHFFKGVFGLQFTDHAGLRALRHELPEEAIYWLNALDPISPCGLGLSAWKGRFPPRVGSTHLVFRGRELVMVSKRLGRAVELFVAADDPRLPEVLQVFKDLLSRQFDPLKSVLVETINDEPAHTSPFAPALRAFGFVKDFRQLALYRRF